MHRIFEEGESIVLENTHAVIRVAKKDATLQEVLDKKTGQSLLGERTAFFSLHTRENEIAVTGLSLAGDRITLSSACGNIEIAVEAYDEYFTFELKTALPKGVFRAYIAHAKYQYDPKNKENTGAVAIAMTIWMNPTYYPDAKSLETRGEVLAHTGSIGAKLGLIVAPIRLQRDIIKTASLTIDKSCGICSKTMMMLYPLMEAVRSGGDLANLGGDGKYTKTIVCPDGCVIFRLTATPLGNENFHQGGFWDYPDQT